MNKDLQKIEDSIKRKHSFNWTPKYKEEARTELNKKVFIPIVIKAFEKLGWDLVYQDELIAEAKRKNSWNKWTEKISVTFDFGKVLVKSVSLGNEMWDNGRNSKRVKLFLHVFTETENELDENSLAELEEEIDRKNNWDDYEVPEKLPQPKTRKEPKIWVPICGGILTSLIIGLVLAFLSAKVVTIIFLYEVGVGFAFAYVLGRLIRISNYTNFENLRILLIVMVVVTFISNHYFQYLIILSDISFDSISFGYYLQLKMEAGLLLKGLNTGWIGLIISWIIWLVISYVFGLFRLSLGVIKYQMKRIPSEVVDFAYYHFIKDKTEDQVRMELKKMGWSKTQDQDEVFDAIGANVGATEINRIE